MVENEYILHNEFKAIPSHFDSCSRLIGSSFGGLSWTGVLGANLPLEEVVSVDIFFEMCLCEWLWFREYVCCWMMMSIS